MKYNAFISYNHSADSDLSPKIESALEQFSKPLFKRRALSIFRDSHNLSATPNLWGKIEEALRQSEYFIFFASNKAAQSIWCQKEVEFWIENKNKDNFLIVLTDGDLVWDGEAEDFDWNKTTSLPKSLSGVFENEPLFVDFRELPSKLTMEDQDFAKNTVLLAATLHNKSVEDLMSEDLSIHKKTLRLRNGIIGLLSLLLVLTVWLAVLAYQKQNEAIEQRNEAVIKTNQAKGAGYINASKANAVGNPTLAVRLAEYGYNFAKRKGLGLQKFEEQLIKAFYHPSNFYLKDTEEGANAKTRNDFFQDPKDEDYYPPFKAVRKYGNYELDCTKKYGLHKKPLKKGKRIVRIDRKDCQGISVIEHQWSSFSPKGNFIADLDRVFQNAGQHIEYLRVFDKTGKLQGTAESGTDYNSRFFYPADVKFNADESRLLLFGYETGVQLYDYGEKKRRQHNFNAAAQTILNTAFSSTGNIVALAKKSGLVDIKVIPDRVSTANYYTDEWVLDGHSRGGVHSVDFTEDGKYITTQSNRFTRKWNASNDANNKYIILKGGKPSINDDQVEIAGGEGYIKDLESDLIEYIDSTGKSVAQFEVKEDEYQESSVDKRWQSPDTKYYATVNGVYNQENEQLVVFNSFNAGYKMERTLVSFSTNNKLFFVLDRMIILDAEMILNRLNDYFPETAGFSQEEKVRYSIE